MTPATILRVKNLRKWYDVRRGVIPRIVGHVKAVDDVSFDIQTNEVLGLAGESGSGKTTIGRSVLRLIEPSSGSVVFNGTEVTSLDAGDLRRFRRKAQIIFQDPYSSLDPRMTIEEIVAEPLRVQGTFPDRHARRQRVESLLDSVSISKHFLARRPSELSGGQRQRIGIARALAVEPEFIVADEPLSALDVSIQSQVINLLAELRERLSLTMLFISHDLDVVEYLCDRVVVLYLGKVMEVAETDALFEQPLHPYTRALLAASPKPDPTQPSTHVALQGDIPSPMAAPSGCVFRTRCPHAVDACAGHVPALEEVEPGRWVACIRKEIVWMKAAA